MGNQWEILKSQQKNEFFLNKNMMEKEWQNGKNQYLELI